MSDDFDRPHVTLSYRVQVESDGRFTAVVQLQGLDTAKGAMAVAEKMYAIVDADIEAKIGPGKLEQ